MLIMMISKLDIPHHCPVLVAQVASGGWDISHVEGAGREGPIDDLLGILYAFEHLFF